MGTDNVSVDSLEGRLKESTLVILKPEALVARIDQGIVDEYVKRVLELSIVLDKIFRFTPESLEEFYSHIYQKIGIVRARLEFSYMTRLNSRALVISGPNAVACMRKIVGGYPEYSADGKLVGYRADFQPIRAPPGTIRGNLSSMSLDIAQMIGISVPNLVHASDSPESYQRETKILLGRGHISQEDFKPVKNEYLAWLNSLRS